VPVESNQPDPFLVAAAVRPDSVFSYHSALEFLGAAHSVWIGKWCNFIIIADAYWILGISIRQDPTEHRVF
jgi:hypothetical protein